MKLASPNRRSKNIGVLPIVIAELELSDIQRHIFLPLTLWKEPAMPRLIMDQKPSMV
jgi:hypothetical protein